MPAMVGYLNHWATAAPSGASRGGPKPDYLQYLPFVKSNLGAQNLTLHGTQMFSVTPLINPLYTADFEYHQDSNPRLDYPYYEIATMAIRL
ncbi:hypothetical protein TNCV_2754761 [Trichonephila clavipes]|nr:hypothetical protein TNCV_2754761 [Trichonephila clavipes]